MIKVVFIDIDGTLSDSKKNISQRNINAIKRATEKGILVVICSGRPRLYTENVSKKCCASKYIINSNGTNIYDYDKNESIYTNSMNRNAIIELYNLAEKENTRLILDTVNLRRVTKCKKTEEDEILLEEDIGEFVEKNEIIQCVLTDYNIETMQKLLPEIERIKGIEIKNRHRTLIDPAFKNNSILFYDIASIGITKGTAIKELIRILNIKKEDTVAIGDDNNDLSMFEQVGYKVAMGNALECLKEQADEVVPTNNEDGVAVFLEKILNVEV